MRPLLEARSLKKAFHFPKKQIVLDGVDLTLGAGESAAIIGRSGEGKSTLLQILGTLDAADEGQIYYKGALVTSASYNALRRSSFGFIFQSFHLLDDFTVLENILMPARIARKNTAKGSESYQAAVSILERVGLLSHAENFAKQLSGGEKQRVAIARALVNKPELIFADEPTGNLDYQTSQEIRTLLFELLAQTGAGLVLVTHDTELASTCDSSYRLQSGLLEPIDIGAQKR
ncbi:MAG: ABC transporter ATP-binding protein [Chlamydiia bacterium]|nr:ABC transporter ATP-binding protein [Chlamydiia bacterium]